MSNTLGAKYKPGEATRTRILEYLKEQTRPVKISRIARDGGIGRSSSTIRQHCLVLHKMKKVRMFKANGKRGIVYVSIAKEPA